MADYLWKTTEAARCKEVYEQHGAQAAADATPGRSVNAVRKMAIRQKWVKPSVEQDIVAYAQGHVKPFKVRMVVKYLARTDRRTINRAIDRLTEKGLLSRRGKFYQLEKSNG